MPSFDARPAHLRRRSNGDIPRSTIMDLVPPQPSIPLTMFTLFSSLPIELRLMVWKYALPPPRIVHIKQRRLKELDGNWWERVRSDIAMWPCDKPFQQDELAPWEKDDWDAKFEADYEGDDVFNDGTEVKRLDRESQKEQYDGDDLLDDLAELERLDRESQEEEYDGYDVLDDLGEIERLDREIRDLGATAQLDASEDGWDTKSLQELEFGDGVDEPKELWGFSTESPTPSLLLTCRESRDIPLKVYQPAFSSLGGIPQVYFDPHRDTLFIDHETFFEVYEALPALIAMYILPSDLARITELAVEGLGAYEEMQYGSLKFDSESEYPHESWLFASSVLFPNIEKVTEICNHVTYGPKTQTGQNYVGLKRLIPVQDGKDIYRRPEDLIIGPAHGTFYVNCLRVDRSLMDWDKILDRHFDCYSGEEQLYELFEEWQENNPGSKPAKINFDWADLIPAADEKLLLHDALIFEKEHNNGQWLSFWDPRIEFSSTTSMFASLHEKHLLTNEDVDPNVVKRSGI